MRNSASALLIAISSVFLVACSDPAPVAPKIPKVDDPKNPVDLEGNRISMTQFLMSYCQIPEPDENCIKVGKAAKMSSTRTQY